MRDKVKHTAVADDHALRRAGRAGGEVAVKRVAVRRAAADGGQCAAVRLGLEQFLDQQHAPRARKGRGLRGMRAVSDKARRLRDREDLLKPRLRQRGRQRDIKPARVYRTKHGVQRCSALFEQHRHGRAGQDMRGQRCATAFAVTQQHIKVVHAVPVDHGRLVRADGSRAF